VTQCLCNGTVLREEEGGGGGAQQEEEEEISNVGNEKAGDACINATLRCDHATTVTMEK
jgi:hypothetical protein